MNVLEKEKGFSVFIEGMTALELDTILRAGAILAPDTVVATTIRQDDGAPMFDAVFFVPVGPDSGYREKAAKILKAMDVIE